MDINKLIHPEDAKALKALKSIPALPKLLNYKMLSTHT